MSNLEKLPNMTDDEFLFWVASAMRANAWDEDLRCYVAARLMRMSTRRSQRPYVTIARLLTYTGPKEEIEKHFETRSVKEYHHIKQMEIHIRETIMEVDNPPNTMFTIQASIPAEGADEEPLKCGICGQPTVNGECANGHVRA